MWRRTLATTLWLLLSDFRNVTDISSIPPCSGAIAEHQRKYTTSLWYENEPSKVIPQKLKQAVSFSSCRDSAARWTAAPGDDGKSRVFEAVSAITMLLRRHFPGTAVYPVSKCIVYNKTVSYRLLIVDSLSYYVNPFCVLVAPSYDPIETCSTYDAVGLYY